MKIIIMFVLVVFISINTYSQGWVGNGSSLVTVNSPTTLQPTSVGIGVQNPSAQLHTNGSLRFEGLLNDESKTRFLVADQFGNLSYKVNVIPNISNIAWQLLGNANTNPIVNFIGTTDNQPLAFRVANTQRMTIDLPNPASQVAAVNVGSLQNPTSLNVFSRDIAGSSIPYSIITNITGLTYGPAVGRTLGRQMRLISTNGAINNFFDFGIGPNNSCFYITGRLNGGTGTDPNKMLVISNTNVGINMGAQGAPSANFHTIGTVRFQNLPQGTGNVLVADANGNVFRSQSIAVKSVQNENAALIQAKKDITQLQNQIIEIQNLLNLKKNEKTNQSQLIGNYPNPTRGETEIIYKLSDDVKVANLYMYSNDAKLIQVIKLNNSIKNSKILVDLTNYNLNGIYFYALEVDGKIIDTKSLILTH
jgi:hypothetical protein